MQCGFPKRTPLDRPSPAARAAAARRREPVGEVIPIAAVDDYAQAHLMDLHAVAVELHLMQSTTAGGHFLGADWAAGRNEAERGHASGCSGIAPAAQLTVGAIAVSP
jgi:hypothetical protein